MIIQITACIDLNNINININIKNGGRGRGRGEMILQSAVESNGISFDANLLHIFDHTKHQKN
jgi:hypothetical protein